LKYFGIPGLNLCEKVLEWVQLNPLKEKLVSELDLLRMVMHLEGCPYLSGEDTLMILEMSKFLLVS